MMVQDYLDKISQYKINEVAELKKEIVNDTKHPIQAILNGQKYTSNRINFKSAIQNRAVIAELKRCSPSTPKGFTPQSNDEKLAAYLQGGANAISVLTDLCGFNGSVDDLIAARAVALQYHCPVLRKDFIIDEVQIAQSILIGADAILLIVNFLGDKTAALFQCAKKLSIDVVVEVFDRDELDYALSFGADIIAVNNRYLRSMTIDTQNALRLIPYIPQNVTKIAASGIEDIDTAHGFFQAGYNAVLIGTSLMKHTKPSSIIQAIRSKPVNATVD